LKKIIIYSVIFFAAFAATTAGVIYFNSLYTNIFSFDFSPRIVEEEKEKTELIVEEKQEPNDTKIPSEINENLLDSLTIAKKDSVVEIKTDEEPLEKETLVETPKTEPTIVKPVMNLEPTTGEIEIVKPEPKDTSYLKWAKHTAGLYESMDSKKAAKIIQNYSDNIARDILYAMKKKKAAEILAEFNPEAASRIIRLR
jgi:flagellar motility protein MotE (MotC chaperone)